MLQLQCATLAKFHSIPTAGSIKLPF